MKGFLYIFFTVISEVVSTAALKETQNFTKPLPICVMSIGYVLSFLFLSLALKITPMSVVYSVSSGLGIVFSCLISRFYFNQSLDYSQILGIVLIFFGVLLSNGTNIHNT